MPDILCPRLGPRQFPENLFTALIITLDLFQKGTLVFRVVRHRLSRQAASRAAATRGGGFSIALPTELFESLASQASEYRNDEFERFVSLVDSTVSTRP
jgi:hypothetical protein